MNQLRNNPELRAAFEEFALFGTPRTAAVPNPVQMDNAKFAKLCRDSGLVDNICLSLIDVDIIFAKCKQPGKRKLVYADFQRALREIADTRQCDVEHVVAMVVTAAPEINGTIPQVTELIEKLTDTSLYTGTHKARFDPVTGQGLGLDGRDTVNTTANLSSIVSRHNSAKTLGSKSLPTPHASHPSSPTGRYSEEHAGGRAGSVFDRLNDVSTFTGTHKHRFNEDGTGRGKAGRE
ncbi:UNVERIFIED_CONTAM: Tubulin polymerization-promoting protein member 2 [Siphonaria sp. JEL0065]|nr:Tubulin polymerization-promoting protein member 2 [Siphonaria sp. JEL0065]